MPFPVDIKWVMAAEGRLGVSFPDAFKTAMQANNGGTVEADGVEWELHPFRDESDARRIARTCNDIEHETKEARSWHGFPADGVAVGSNGAGDVLLFLRSSSKPDQLEPTVYVWDHETGELQPAATSFEQLDCG